MTSSTSHSLAQLLVELLRCCSSLQGSSCRKATPARYDGCGSEALDTPCIMHLRRPLLAIRLMQAILSSSDKHRSVAALDLYVGGITPVRLPMTLLASGSFIRHLGTIQVLEKNPCTFMSFSIHSHSNRCNGKQMAWSRQWDSRHGAGSNTSDAADKHSQSDREAAACRMV